MNPFERKFFDEFVHRLEASGIRTLVAGSSVYGAADPAAAIGALRAAAQEGLA